MSMDKKDTYDIMQPYPEKSFAQLKNKLYLYWLQNGNERLISGDKRRYPVLKR